MRRASRELAMNMRVAADTPTVPGFLRPRVRADRADEQLRTPRQHPGSIPVPLKGYLVIIQQTEAC